MLLLCAFFLSNLERKDNLIWLTGWRGEKDNWVSKVGWHFGWREKDNWVGKVGWHFG
jgi:hypothetical protein